MNSLCLCRQQHHRGCRPGLECLRLHAPSDAPVSSSLGPGQKNRNVKYVSITEREFNNLNSNNFLTIKGNINKITTN